MTDSSMYPRCCSALSTTRRASEKQRREPHLSPCDSAVVGTGQGPPSGDSERNVLRPALVCGAADERAAGEAAILRRADGTLGPPRLLNFVTSHFTNPSHILHHD